MKHNVRTPMHQFRLRFTPAAGRWRRALLCALCCLSFHVGCTSKQASEAQSAPEEALPAHNWREELAAIPSPVLPPGLSTGPAPSGNASTPSAASSAAPALSDESPRSGLPYTVEILSPEKDLVAPLEAASLSVRLKDDLPDDLTGLERRIRSDEAEAKKVLQSYGYYAGTARADVDQSSSPARVRIELDPGPLYHIDVTPITYTQPVARWDKAPQSLEDAGLTADQAARAGDILDAVGRVEKQLRDHGYPFAKVESSRYIVDHEKHTLEARISINPGRYAEMGKVVVQGTDSVRPDYFNRMRTWQNGTPWSESTLARYQEELTTQGLFRSISLRPADEPAPDGSTPILAEVADSPQRTVSAGVRYDSDRGPGVQFAWEHRNLLDSGERLRLTAEWWRDLQDVRAVFRIPAFLRRNQTFTAEAGMHNESTDAYDLSSAWAGAGLERHFWDIWQASAMASAQGGTLRSNRNPRNAYSMVGLPLSLRRDSTGSLLNPIHGSRAAVSVAPYIGAYDGAFTATVVRFDGSAYYDVLGNERLVLAGRVSVGNLVGDGGSVPAILLFYSGGGGSVRGYSYQSLGPRDQDNDPLGGKSLLETSLEMRIKITDAFGIVPFLDGGNVYNTGWDGLSDPSLRWGAGLGFRYYTPVGPIRLDLAAPLNRRKDDAPWQVYVSIGQSF